MKIFIDKDYVIGEVISIYINKVILFIAMLYMAI